MPANAPLLVLCNKQDLSRAMRPDQVAEALNLRSHMFHGHEWYLQPCSATTGDGIFEGLEWLHKTIRAKPREKTLG